MAEKGWEMRYFLLICLAAMQVHGVVRAQAAECRQGEPASRREIADTFQVEGLPALPYRQVVVGAELPGKFDIVLFLHGAGERGTDNEQHLVFGYAPMVEFCVENRIKAVLLFPQCPPRRQWSAIRIPERDPTLTPEPEPPLAAAVALLQVKRGEFEIGRTYAVGISMGGYGVWDALARYQGLFSAGVAGWRCAAAGIRSMRSV